MPQSEEAIKQLWAKLVAHTTLSEGRNDFAVREVLTGLDHP